MIWAMTLAGQFRAGSNSKAHHYQQSVQKNKGPFENMALTRKQFENFRRKKTIILDPSKNPSVTPVPQGHQLNIFFVNSNIKKLNKTSKKAFRSKLLELCKTRTKKSSRDMFNFYVILAGHDMVTDAGGATTCRRKIKPHDYK